MKSVGAFFLVAALFAPLTISAQPRRAVPPPPQQSIAPSPVYYSCDPGDNVPARTHSKYDCSGTIGRVGLGASPFHPEGPGNVTFGR